ncbi:carbon-nitrogen hydrolase family protein [Actinokineospora xionganensis]|uniref:Carbon-nitrogen hydrolase family protein n=1 Tax=Actinokineospora xionganensis TaxID=2684470 RepID=A0ABR7L4Z2_9PSEU|nr:carbon-nitrogen hydrolase family protein [Actinokineospora xionganensis]MBC6447746.1 carbon-nitrogen hydrolase family protein [Actinokineospora xionganensis]
MRVALCQISATADPEANLALVREGVRQADGASVVLFPEATMSRFGVPLGPVAQPLDGPWPTAVRAIAGEHGVVVVAGMFTPDPDGRVRNTLLVTGRGQHLGYDKIHLFDAFGFAESRTVAPGDAPVTIEVDGITLGVATCYDVRFPELFRALADRGAKAVLLGASWGAGEGKLDQWELLVRARALDCTSWVLACGQADPGPVTGTAPLGIGHSLVADPRGRVVASLEGKPDVLVVDIDTELVDTTRAAIPVLENRRL